MTELIQFFQKNWEYKFGNKLKLNALYKLKLCKIELI